MKLVLNLSLALAALAAGGCVSKGTSRAQSQAAFMAGQAAAYQAIQEAQPTEIRVVGPVRRPIVIWTEGLTLMEAIVAADCTSQRNPRSIFIVRQGGRIAVDVRSLLKGDDVPLEPGDTIELVQ